MPKMQIPMDPEKNQPKGMPSMQETTRPELEHKVAHTGYGTAYNRTDVSFVALERVYLNLANPRYAGMGRKYENQKAAIDSITDDVDVRNLRKTIKAVGLERPLEVFPYREGYKVVDGGSGNSPVAPKAVNFRSLTPLSPFLGLIVAILILRWSAIPVNPMVLVGTSFGSLLACVLTVYRIAIGHQRQQERRQLHSQPEQSQSKDRCQESEDVRE